MSLLKEFEKKLERSLEGFFAKKFKKALEPVELAKKLARVMEEGRTISVTQVYAPNNYLVYTSQKDKERLSSFEPALKKELQDFLEKAAQKGNLTFPSRLQIEILPKEELSLGEVEVESKLEVKELPEESPKPERFRASLEGERLSRSPQGTKMMPLEKLKTPSFSDELKPRANLLLLNGKNKKFSLEKEVITLGRLENNDIRLRDVSVSRLHAEIRWENNHFFLIDLGSTNGTFLGQKRIKKAALKEGQVLTLGKTRLRFSEEEGA